ncbi:hypothetical protein SDC9_162752 [bioreactor metagenome]|uniref:Uncharacterized protein n=1 Tax=bioreactor metagenome TaxID=1076179 RepID=A0A645FN99_9ZZZZ
MLHLFLDLGEQLRLVLTNELIKLRLALAEVELWILFKVKNGIGEGARRFLAGDGQRPQPGHINMGVTCGELLYRQRLPGSGNPLFQSLAGRRQTGIESLAQWCAGVQHGKSRFKRT